MSATLGGLIKDYRQQKNIPQMEIAFALGWSEPSRLSRIEQGKVGTPSRTFIDRLATAMRLEEEEKNQLLLVGNYLPSSEEIEHVRSQLHDSIHNWPYPAILYDFSWRVVDANQRVVNIYRHGNGFYSEILKKDITILDVVFSQEYILNQNLTTEEEKKRHNFLLFMLASYQQIQRNRTKESWYIAQIRRLLPNPIFRELWQEISTNKIVALIGYYGQKSVIEPNASGKILNFYFFIESVVKDPRFSVELYVPANVETHAYFKHQ